MKKEIKDERMLIKLTKKEKRTIKRYAKQKSISMSRLLINTTMSFIKRYPVKEKLARGK